VSYLVEGEEGHGRLDHEVGREEKSSQQDYGARYGDAQKKKKEGDGGDL
jgi:hypothetical protein